MVEAYRQLRESSRQATSLRQWEEAGHRFGEVVGDNGTRVLIMVALAASGGREGMSVKGPRLPGYARAALASETNSGLRLAAVAEGGVQSITISPGTLVVGAAPNAVATVAWGTGGPQPKGSLTGRPSRPNPNDTRQENIDAIKRENESARTLADNGYDVEQNPPGPVTNKKNPDYRINGEYSDCYAPTTSRPRNIWERIGRKVREEQAKNIVLNLDDSLVELTAMREQLSSWPIPELKRVIAIKGGHIIPLFP